MKRHRDFACRILAHELSIGTNDVLDISFQAPAAKVICIKSAVLVNSFAKSMND